ncbi:hypothetical protein GCM10009740_17010 [Terrabacter terrae]|uniref:DUF2062 domain-containing protein n=1 Tax=Terrabacter terrae TaxID=318434 RepID=A0ABN2U2M1_9MICO
MYLAVGAIVGALVPNPVNGTVIVMFAWILDVFFGPTLSGSPSPLLRLLPTHFITLWTVDLPPGHAGPSTLMWSLLWVLGALIAAAAVVSTAAGVRRSHARAPRSLSMRQLRTSLRMGRRQWRRTAAVALLLRPSEWRAERTLFQRRCQPRSADRARLRPTPAGPYV